MTIDTHDSDHPSVVSIDGHVAAWLAKQLAALLPAGAQVDIIRHPEIDERTGVALKLSLPARPNRVLPGTCHPASAPFAIEVSRRLLLRHMASGSNHARGASSLAAWIRAHVSGAAPAVTGTQNGGAPPLTWRFTASASNDLDMCTERVRTAFAA